MTTKNKRIRASTGTSRGPGPFLSKAHGAGLDVSVCERARLSRDRRFDGVFFIGVVTTGIYCRPICPVQPPKPKNVTFYPSAAAAEDAGLRPCLRCRPECSPGSPAWGGTSSTVNRALRLIDEGALDEQGVEGLAAKLGVGDRHLRRLFQQHLGAPPASVARTRRLLLAKQLIDESELPMGQVAMAAGYGSVRRFNEAVRKNWGRTPSELRRRRVAATARRSSAGSPGKRSGVPPESAANRPVLCSEPPIELRLSYQPPYDFERLLDFLAPRAIPGVAAVADGCYRRSFESGESRGLVEVENDSEHNVLLARVHLDRPGSLLPLAERLRRLFDLYARPSEIETVLGQDPLLADRWKQQPGLRVAGAWDGYEIGIRAILGQQVTVKGATTLAARFVEKWGSLLAGMQSPSITHIFPRAETIAAQSPARLARRIGVPVARGKALIEFSRAVAAGRVDLSGATDPALLVEQLVSLPGIGPWTAQYVAMRALGDPDAFPGGDLGLRKALEGALESGRDGLPSEARVLERAEAWRPWRSYAAMLLWQVDPAESSSD